MFSPLKIFQESKIIVANIDKWLNNKRGFNYCRHIIFQANGDIVAMVLLLSGILYFSVTYQYRRKKLLFTNYSKSFGSLF